VHEVFISYSKQDHGRVERLVRALEAEGWSVYWDRKLLAGEAWHEEIARELAGAQCVIVAWSAQSAASNWVRDEATQAHARGALVPVLIEAVPIPLGFGQIHTIPVIGADGGLIAESLPILFASVRRLADAPRGGPAPGPIPVAAPASSTVAAPPPPAVRTRVGFSRLLFPLVLPLLTVATLMAFALALYEKDVALAWLAVAVGSGVTALSYRRLSRPWIDRTTFSAELVSAMAIPASAVVLATAVLYLGPVMWRTTYALIAGAAGAGLALAAVTRGWTVRTQPTPRVAGYAATAAVVWFATAFFVATHAVDTLKTHYASPSSYQWLHAAFLEDLGSGGWQADTLMLLWLSAALMTAIVGRALRAGLVHGD